MKHYIKNNEIFAFELDGSQDHLITSDMKEISLEEIQAMNRAKEEEYKSTVEYKIQEAKDFLSRTDYKMLPSYEPKEGEDMRAVDRERYNARQFIRDNK